MKYAVLGPQLGINRISETEPAHVGPQSTVTQVTDEQAEVVLAGQEATPRIRYFLVSGELKTFAEKQELERLAAMSPEELSRQQLREGLLSVWDQTFTAGEKAFLKPIFDAAVSRFDAGDIAGAKAIIETAPSISEDLDQKKAGILNLFPSG